MDETIAKLKPISDGFGSGDAVIGLSPADAAALASGFRLDKDAAAKLSGLTPTITARALAAALKAGPKAATPAPDPAPVK